jgi:hypothetical protein
LIQHKNIIHHVIIMLTTGSSCSRRSGLSISSLFPNVHFSETVVALPLGEALLDGRGDGRGDLDGDPMASWSVDVLKRLFAPPGEWRGIGACSSSSSCLYEVRGGRCVLVFTSLTAISGTASVAEVDGAGVSNDIAVIGDCDI